MDSIAPDGSTSDREGQMMIYQITVNDLTCFKSQQWSLTNHSFLLLAALVGTKQLLGESATPFEHIILAGLAVLVVTAGQVLLTKLQNSILVRQARLDAAREKLGFQFYKTWATKDKGTEYIHSVWILRSALLIGGSVACWVLVRPLVL